MYRSRLDITQSAEQPAARSVSEISQLIQSLLKDDPQLSNVRIIGEVSGHSQPASGHSYFALRDREATLRCVMFRYNRGHQFLEDGALVVCEGSAGVYAPRGDLQIVVTSAEPAGIGDQQARLEELQRRLRAEGLFEDTRKRPLPRFPKRIAVITSEHGAVWHDIRDILSRRYPLAELILIPSAVQGDTAPSTIVEAFAELDAFCRERKVDVVIVARGGGSPEDLMAYNDETVARTIYASRVPVVSAIGHETDYTIADQVADLRAPTPSAAAELVSPDVSDLHLETHRRASSLMRSLSARVDLVGERFALTQDRLVAAVPDIQEHRENVEILMNQAMTARNLVLSAKRDALRRVEVELKAISPYNVLERGYVMARDSGGEFVTSSKQLAPNDLIELTFIDGSAQTEVRSVSTST